MKLYEISQEMEVLQRLLEEEDCDQESFEAAIQSLNIELEAKVANIGLLIKNLRADIEARKVAIERLQADTAATERRIDWLKGYLLAHLPDRPVKTALVTVRRNQGREQVSITGDVPVQYLVVVPPRPDKAALLHDLKEGREIPGAELIRGEDFVTIR